MKRPYKIVHETSTTSSRELADWLAKDGQLLVPLVELLEKGERAIDEVIDVMGRTGSTELVSNRIAGSWRGSTSVAPPPSARPPASASSSQAIRTVSWRFGSNQEGDGAPARLDPFQAAFRSKCSAAQYGLYM